MRTNVTSWIKKLVISTTRLLQGRYHVNEPLLQVSLGLSGQVKPHCVDMRYDFSKNFFYFLLKYKILFQTLLRRTIDWFFICSSKTRKPIGSDIIKVIYQEGEKRRKNPDQCVFFGNFDKMLNSKHLIYFGESNIGRLFSFKISSFLRFKFVHFFFLHLFISSLAIIILCEEKG